MKQYLIVTPDIYELPIAVHDTVKEISVTYGIPLQSVYTAIHNHSVNRKINARIEEVEVGFYLGDCALPTNSAQKKCLSTTNKTNKQIHKGFNKTKRYEIRLPLKLAKIIDKLCEEQSISASLAIKRIIDGVIL